VFKDFSVLAPTWLTIVLPGFALIAYLLSRLMNRRPARRAPVRVTGSGAKLAALAASARVRRLQSGRLSAYLLYMLIALIAALVLIPILH
jgi:hypothetical protein